MPGKYVTGAAFCLAASLLASTSAAQIVTIPFEATRTNIDAPFSAPPGPQRCGALFTVNIGNGPMSSATGTSNFGNFGATQSHCINPTAATPNPFSDGLFNYVFDEGGSLFGTYFGELTDGAAPGIFNTLETYTITGGTGRFLDATGQFVGNGTVNFTGAGPVANVNFLGSLTSAVPEPATWAMMLIGFGFVGGALRRRRRVAVFA